MCGLKCELRGHQPVKSARSFVRRSTIIWVHVAAVCHDHYDVAGQILFDIRTGGRALLYLTAAFFALCSVQSCAHQQ
jgi:hypothetical protein